MRDDPATRAYLTRRRAEGKTDREIRRCLKRYITRQLYRALTAAMSPAPATPPTLAGLVMSEGHPAWGRRPESSASGQWAAGAIAPVPVYAGRRPTEWHGGQGEVAAFRPG
jgi:hypothetical protein